MTLNEYKNPFIAPVIFPKKSDILIKYYICKLIYNAYMKGEEYKISNFLLMEKDLIALNIEEVVNTSFDEEGYETLGFHIDSDESNYIGIYYLGFNNETISCKMIEKSVYYQYKADYYKKRFENRPFNVIEK